MEKEEYKNILEFVSRITIIHVVTYFIVGLILSTVQNREVLYATYGANYMRPTTDILVYAGPLFQLIRGPIIALVIYPLREKLFNKEEKGWLYLFILLIGIGFIASVGPAPGNIEGFIYTTVAIEIALSGYPEVIIQSLAFSYLAYIWENDKKNKKIQIPLLAAFIIVLLLSSIAVLTYGMV